MNFEQFNLQALYLFGLLLFGLFVFKGILSVHLEKQESTARKVLAQFADYMLANLMSPEDVTLIDCASEFQDDATYNEYQAIYLEASRLSARQNLTGEDLSKLIEQAKQGAERIRKEGSARSL